MSNLNGNNKDLTNPRAVVNKEMNKKHGIPIERILFTHKREDDFYLLNANETTLSYTDDFSNLNTILIGGRKFYLNERYLLASQVIDDKIHLKVSESNAKNYNMRDVKFNPTGKESDNNKVIMHNSNFTVLDASGVSIFLNIAHESKKFGNIYKSSNKGNSFIKSLDYNVKSNIYFDFDFERVI